MTTSNPIGTPALLDPATQPKFVNELPSLPQIDATDGGRYVIEMHQFDQWLGLVDEKGDPILTTVWGYGLKGQTPTYPGPTINAETGVPISVKWVNKLPDTGPLLPVDTSIHMNQGERDALAQGLIPTIVHQHGGHHSPEADGYPEAWYTQRDEFTGPDFSTGYPASPRWDHDKWLGHNAQGHEPAFDPTASDSIAGHGRWDRNQGGTWDNYPNDQPGADLWYHDHALGLTRINVGSGLAGLYELHDQQQQDLMNQGVLPDAAHNVQAIIQDRAFTSDGHLYLPAYPDDPIPGTTGTVADMLPPNYSGPTPTIVPEFFGDNILVNGMDWPKFDADPTQYEFHFLNASDSRTYVLQLDDPSVKVTLVGVDGGLLPHAVTISNGDGIQQPGENILLSPSERVDLVFDFSHSAGHDITLQNVGPDFSPFQGFNPDGTLASSSPDMPTVAATPNEGVGNVMQFDVSNHAAPPQASVTDGTPLNTTYTPLNPADAVETRQLGLFEQDDQYGRVMPMLGVATDTTDINGNPVAAGPLHWDDPITEDPKLNTTEIWNFFNFTKDTHPIHVHLVEYQVL